MSSTNKHVASVIAAYLALSDVDQRKCAELIGKLAGTTPNSFASLPYFAQPIFANGSASPPPTPLSTPIPVAMLENQQQQHQQQQEKNGKWSNRGGMEKVKEAPQVIERPTETVVERNIPAGSVSICNNSKCKCFGLYTATQIENGHENHPGWDPVKLTMFCNHPKYRDSNVDDLRDIAEVAVGGSKKRKELVSHTFARERYEDDTTPPRIELTCRSHQAAVQAMWNIWEARERLGITVNWGYKYHSRRDRSEEQDDQEEQEEEN